MTGRRKIAEPNDRVLVACLIGGGLALLSLGAAYSVIKQSWEPLIGCLAVAGAGYATLGFAYVVLWMWARFWPRPENQDYDDDLPADDRSEFEHGPHERGAGGHGGAGGGGHPGGEGGVGGAGGEGT